MRVIRLLSFLVPVLAGCPNLSSNPIPSTCAQHGARCKLPTGPLGVCDSVPCPAPGDPPPCLRCIPQH